MKYLVTSLLVASVILLLFQGHKFRSQKLHEADVLFQGFKGIHSLLADYDKQMWHFDIQIGHQLVPDESHYRNSVLECKDAITQADSPLRRLVREKIGFLASCKETDTGVAPLQSEIVYHQAILGYLDKINSFMDTSLSLSEYRERGRKYHKAYNDMTFRERKAWDAICSFKDKWAID